MKSLFSEKSYVCPSSMTAVSFNKASVDLPWKFSGHIARSVQSNIVLDRPSLKIALR